MRACVQCAARAEDVRSPVQSSRVCVSGTDAIPPSPPAHHQRPAAQRAAERRLLSEAASRGVSPSRLHFHPVLGRQAYFERFARHVDLFLDTRLVTAHSTAADVLWSGVPLLTVVTATMHVGVWVVRAAGKGVLGLWGTRGKPTRRALDRPHACGCSFARQ
jgi:hypothetical protein